MQPDPSEKFWRASDDERRLSPSAVASLLETHRDSLLEGWARRVLADAELPSASVLTRPALYDHFPEIVNRLVATLRSAADHPEDLGRLVGATEEAQSHVRGRI